MARPPVKSAAPVKAAKDLAPLAEEPEVVEQAAGAEPPEGTDGPIIDLNDAAVNRRFGMLAKQCSGKHLPLEVCYSARGFYLGTRDSDGCPYSRESQEYWTKRDEAQAALDANLWTQLQHA